MSATDLVGRIALFLPVLFSLTVHEWAHARVALALGDDTALRQGRVTLDPLAHLDPLGTVLLPLLGLPFGWAKPVPVDPGRFREDVTLGRGILLTAAAGPVANLCLAALATALSLAHGLLFPGAHPALAALFHQLVVVNLALALFNLLPFPPLDGSRIVDGLVPFRFRSLWNRVGSAGAVALFALIALAQLSGLWAALWGALPGR